MIGIFIGIAAVVALISLGQGLQVAIEEQFESIGTNKIFITPGAGFGPPGLSRDKLTDKDISLVREVNGVKVASGIIEEFIDVKFNNRRQFLPFHSHPTEGEEAELMDEVERFEFEEGRNFRNDGEVIVGFDLSNDENLFDRKVKLRNKLEIEGKKFEVVGILKRKGNPIDDKHIYLGKEDSEKLLDLKDKFDFIIIEVEGGRVVSEVAEDIKEEMRRDRNLKEGEEDFTVQTFEDIFEVFTNVFGIVQAVLVGIAAISLIVGGIGIMNTMYMTVLERTKEIGTMKAVGAKNSDILYIFLFESGLLGLVGGAIGVGIGIGLAKGAEYIANTALGTPLLRAFFPWYLIIGALAFSFLIGTASGILPAMQAAKLKPAEALRYE